MITRAPLVVLGMAVAIIGYAIVYNGMNRLGSSHFGCADFTTALIPGRECGAPAKAVTP